MIDFTPYLPLPLIILAVGFVTFFRVLARRRQDSTTTVSVTERAFGGLMCGSLWSLFLVFSGRSLSDSLLNGLLATFAWVLMSGIIVRQYRPGVRSPSPTEQTIDRTKRR